MAGHIPIDTVIETTTRHMEPFPCSMVTQQGLSQCLREPLCCSELTSELVSYLLAQLH